MTEIQSIDREIVDAVVKRINEEVAVGGVEWPGGWPDEVEAAVIDAVYSIRARYGSETTGVRAVVASWRKHRGGGKLDDLHRLASFHDQPEEILKILKNEQKLQGEMTKAQGCAQVAKALICAGASTSEDMHPDRELKKAWNSVHGLGNVTWSYVLMLLGHQDVKADTMIRRFVQLALDDAGISATADPTLARSAVMGAAAELSTTRGPIAATTLDHAIWRHQRNR